MKIIRILGIFIFLLQINACRPKERYVSKVLISLHCGREKGEFSYQPYNEIAPICLGGFAFNPAGDIYVGDSGNMRVLKYDKNGLFLKEIGVGVVKFNYFAVDKYDNLYIAPRNSGIYIFNKNGQLIRKMKKGGRVEQDTWYNIYVFHGLIYDFLSDSYIDISIREPDENGQEFTSQYADCYNKAGEYYTIRGGAGKLYAAKNWKGDTTLVVKKYSPERKLLKEYSVKQLQKTLITTMVVGCDGSNNIYVLGISKKDKNRLLQFGGDDKKVDVVVKFDENGEVLAVIKLTGLFPDEYKLFVDEHGNVYQMMGRESYSEWDDNNFKIIKYLKQDLSEC